MCIEPVHLMQDAACQSHRSLARERGSLEHSILMYAMDRIVCSCVPWPLVLALILLHFCGNCALPVQDLMFLECFAGNAEVSNALRELGMKGHTHDFSHHKSMDILSPAGFMPASQTIALNVSLFYTPNLFGLRLCLYSMLRVRPGGLWAAGPVCSSWFWICRNSSLDLNALVHANQPSNQTTNHPTNKQSIALLRWEILRESARL